MIYLICIKCGQSMPEDNFYIRSGLKRRGACKGCLLKQSEAYSKDPKNRMAIRASTRDAMRRLRSDPIKLKKQRSAEMLRRNGSPKYSLNLALHNAKKRSVVSVSVDYLLNIWATQEGRCALSGIRMTWGMGGIKPTSISIDRINHCGPYEVGNIRLVCYCVNAFRQRMTDGQMIEMAKAIVDYADKGEVSFPTGPQPAHMGFL